MTTATPPSASEHTLTIPARPEAVRQARRACRDAATQAGLHPDRIDDLAVAVTEAVTNAIEAQLANGTEVPVVVRCTTDDRHLTIEVHDQGGGFRPDARPEPGTHGDRGWGIHLMHELAAEVAFEAVPGGTVVRLAFER